MTVLQMQCFLEAARTGSFAAASERLYISQPTMSRQIRTLEEELQALLFVRDHNAVQLTDIGRELEPKIRALYENYTGASAEIKEAVNRRLDPAAHRHPRQPDLYRSHAGGGADGQKGISQCPDSDLPSASAAEYGGTAGRDAGRTVYAQYRHGELGSAPFHEIQPGQNVSGGTL